MLPLTLSHRTYDIGFAPHCPLGPIALAASLQVFFASPNATLCEMSWKMHYNTVSDGGAFDLLTYLKNPQVFKVERGSVELLTGPGLGLELDEELIRKEAEESKNFSWRTPACESRPSRGEIRLTWLHPLHQGVGQTEVFASGRSGDSEKCRQSQTGTVAWQKRCE